MKVLSSMKKTVSAMSILLLSASPAFADPGVFLGLTYNFNGSFGIAFKVLSTNKQDRAAAALGATYFPKTGKFGLDAGVGYVFKNGAITFGWDFLNKTPQIGLGYIKTKFDAPTAAPAVAPTPAPVPTPTPTPTPTPDEDGPR
jgi:hypothetical protein